MFSCGHAKGAALVAALLFSPSLLHAQGRPRAPTPPPPRYTTEQGGPEVPPSPHVEENVLKIVPGGITAVQAAARAVATSYGTRSALEDAEAAAARTEQAGLGFVPDLRVTASYKHLSTVTPPSAGVVNGVITFDPAGTPNPQTIATSSSTNPPIFDIYSLQAAVTIPVSDYFLKSNRLYSSVSRSEDAARFDVITARALASVNAKQAFYDWLRARGGVVVAEQTLAVAQAHASDSKIQYGAGAISGADVLRAEGTVAAAEVVLERAKAKAIGADWTIRTLMHAKEDEKIDPGETIDSALPPIKENVKALLAEAFGARPELKSLEKSAEALRLLASAARADRIPALAATGDVLYGNPNPRKLPTTPTFFPSWSVGATLTWSPRTFLIAGPAGGEQDAKASSLESQRDLLRDSIVREVVDAYSNAAAADANIGSTSRQLDAAFEALRVSRTLYISGKATGTALLDAQNALAVARFEHLNARVDARVARVALEHALGRDAIVAAR